MAKKKIYAVKKGKCTGLFDTWEKCQAAVHGYPGAQFRSFSSEEEAKAYLCSNEKKTVFPDTASLTAYVDGSYDQSVGKYAFGCILLIPDGRELRISGSGNNPESLAIRNVAGEMLGAMHAVQWAAGNGYDSLTICYDYEGIEKWATGVWRAKNPLTQKYAEYMRNSARRVRVSFRKVRAHTGDYYNEQVDNLARNALRDVENGEIRTEEAVWSSSTN